VALLAVRQRVREGCGACRAALQQRQLRSEHRCVAHSLIARIEEGQRQRRLLQHVELQHVAAGQAVAGEELAGAAL
jgi:hypothetical protein